MIVFEQVTKVYDPHIVALREVSLTIDKGEFVFLVGPSGSGKSTMMRLLLKELEPTTGRIIVGGVSSTGSSARRFRCSAATSAACSRTSSSCSQPDRLRERRLRAQGAGSVSKREIRTKVPEVLGLVGLSSKMSHMPDELSGGEQQRVSIARAFVNHPPLLICDEPPGTSTPTRPSGSCSSSTGSTGPGRPS